MTDNTTSSSKTVWFLLSTITFIVLSLVGAWGMQTNTTLGTLDTRTRQLELQYAEINGKLDLILSRSVTAPTCSIGSQHKQ